MHFVSSKYANGTSFVENAFSFTVCHRQPVTPAVQLEIENPLPNSNHKLRSRTSLTSIYH